MPMAHKDNTVSAGDSLHYEPVPITLQLRLDR